jgi:protein-tyrosine phosphatase/Fe-S-cluster containining protein
MSEYQLSWITKSIAAGSAPMSFADMDYIKSKGIDAIVNLCAEFSDLHELEETSGFEVYYLPVWDEDVPAMKEMEKALAWLDEAIYLGKKVLIHCRHGIGRTGTFITSYLIRRGHGLKLAAMALKKTKANPTSYPQHKLLKKYHKKSGTLKIREPYLESRHVVDLALWFGEYEALIAKTDDDLKNVVNKDVKGSGCGIGSEECCLKPFKLPFMEVIYLSHKINKVFTSNQRIGLIEKAGNALKQNRQNFKVLCPLNNNNRCSLYKYRPLRCRLFSMEEKIKDINIIFDLLDDLSKNVFVALSGTLWENNNFKFSVAQTVSGKYVQAYFDLLTGGNVDYLS